MFEKALGLHWLHKNIVKKYFGYRYKTFSHRGRCPALLYSMRALQLAQIWRTCD